MIYTHLSLLIHTSKMLLLCVIAVSWFFSDIFYFRARKTGWSANAVIWWSVAVLPAWWTALA